MKCGWCGRWLPIGSLAAAIPKILRVDEHLSPTLACYDDWPEMRAEAIRRGADRASLPEMLPIPPFPTEEILRYR